MDGYTTYSARISHNAGLRADADGIEISKISTSSNNGIPLTFDEWFAIYTILGEVNGKIKLFADAIFEYVLKGASVSEPKFDNYERVISDKVAIGVSVFKPKTCHFISISIQSFFYNPAHSGIDLHGSSEEAFSRVMLHLACPSLHIYVQIEL